MDEAYLNFYVIIGYNQWRAQKRFEQEQAEKQARDQAPPFYSLEYARRRGWLDEIQPIDRDGEHS